MSRLCQPQPSPAWCLRHCASEWLDREGTGTRVRTVTEGFNYLFVEVESLDFLFTELEISRSPVHRVSHQSQQHCKRTNHGTSMPLICLGRLMTKYVRGKGQFARQFILLLWVKDLTYHLTRLGLRRECATLYWKTRDISSG